MILFISRHWLETGYQSRYLKHVTFNFCDVQSHFFREREREREREVY